MAISDRYEDLELVQPTPTGDIYRAKHTVLGRPVLIRTLDVESFSAKEVTAIAQAVTRTAKLVHPNILSVIDAEFEEDFYYVTDNVVASLKSRMDAPFDVTSVARWGLQLLRAISHAHAHGVVHRGISPWRVYFDQVGTVLLADFGLTTGLKDKKTGMVTFEADATAYLPVGVLRNPASYGEAADRYGIAALIVELLTGIVPESTTIDASAALGPVPDAVLSTLSTQLSGRSSATDLERTTAAFKAWVDALGQRPSESALTPPASDDGWDIDDDSDESAKDADSAPKSKTAKTETPAKRRRSARKRTNTGAAKATEAAKVEAPEEPEAAPAEADATAKEDNAGDEQSGSPSADQSAAEAERAEKKLNKYANLFAD